MVRQKVESITVDSVTIVDGEKAESTVKTITPDEVLSVLGNRVAADVPAWNPAFDITPAQLVDFIVTERGVIKSPDRDKIAVHMQSAATA